MPGHAPPAEPGPVKRELRLAFDGKMLDRLGRQTYQGPAAALAELVANGWDADATAVDIRLPDALGRGSAIVVEDNGHGMTFDECREEYMKVGHDRRAGRRGPRTRSGRSAMGRKGIGKFAGFGIARKIRVETTSGPAGEETSFEMDIGDLSGAECLTEDSTIHAVTRTRGTDGQARHWTRITLSGLAMAGNVSRSGLRRSMACRFLAHRTASDFSISVNGAPVPASPDMGAVEFAFPRDYPPGREPAGMRVDGEWAVETLRDGRPVRWTIGFAEPDNGRRPAGNRRVCQRKAGPEAVPFQPRVGSQGAARAAAHVRAGGGRLRGPNRHGRDIRRAAAHRLGGRRDAVAAGVGAEAGGGNPPAVGRAQGGKGGRRDRGPDVPA